MAQKLKLRGSSCISRYLLALSVQAFAMIVVNAGPPLSIDDPGILEPGGLEVILATAGEDTESGSVHQRPILDVSLGLTANTQIAMLIPWQREQPDGESHKSGLSHVELGYKWRFYSTSDVELAIAANYAFSVSHKLITRNGPDDENTFSLPLLASRAMGDWTLLGQVAWSRSSEGEKSWNYGVGMSHPFGESAEVMVELYGDADSSWNNSSLSYQVGIDYAIQEKVHLLGALGKQINSASPQDDKLNYTFYLGLQWFPR
jgi:hypothetical protein